MSLSFAFSSEHEAVRTVRRLYRKSSPPGVRGRGAGGLSPARIRALGRTFGLLGVRYPRPTAAAAWTRSATALCAKNSVICRRHSPRPGRPTPPWHLADLEGRHAGTEGALPGPALAGGKVAGFGLSEPDGGSNVRAMKTRAERVEGGWRCTAASCTSPTRPSPTSC